MIHTFTFADAVNSANQNRVFRLKQGHGDNLLIILKIHLYELYPMEFWITSPKGSERIGKKTSWSMFSHFSAGDMTRGSVWPHACHTDGEKWH